MNEITLRGYLRDVEFSHNIGDIQYEKANLICPGVAGKEDDIISIRYKKFTRKYEEGDFIELKGNLRSYSQRFENKNTVDIYVFTYFDIPDIMDPNKVMLDGRICKMGELKTSKSGKDYVHFTLANNIHVGDVKKINNYIPCTCYGAQAKEVAKLGVNDFIVIEGEFHSHSYKKRNEDGEIEFKVAHEVVVKNIE